MPVPRARTQHNSFWQLGTPAGGGCAVQLCRRAFCSLAPAWVHAINSTFTCCAVLCGAVRRCAVQSGNRLEFVINNGGSDWDKPNPYGSDKGPQNYVIDSPGTYRVKSGRVTRLS